MWSVLGHDKQKKYFENVLKNSALGSAYLFSGPAMIGKKRFAQDLYRLLNSRQFSEGDPDVRFIYPRIEDGDTKIYIEDIRKIKNFLSLSFYRGPYKFVLIDDADRMTEDASNALLKVLEEPPKNSIFILVSSRPKSLLPTVLSRCESVRFMPLSSDLVTEYLKFEKVNKEDQKLILGIANGRLGWAMNVIESGVLSDVKKSIFELEDVLTKGIFEKMQYAKKLYEKGGYIDSVVNWINWVQGDRTASHPRLAKGLLWLNSLISQPQYNHRLALETFLINL